MINSLDNSAWHFYFKMILKTIQCSGEKFHYNPTTLSGIIKKWFKGRREREYTPFLFLRLMSGLQLTVTITDKSKTTELRKKCPYLEFFWPTFSRIWNEYGEIRSISSYSVQMRENTDQKNSEYGHFSSSVRDTSISLIIN